MKSTGYYCESLVEIELYRQILGKNIKFHEKPSSGSRVDPCGRRDRRTDRHEQTNSRFSPVYERV